MNGILRLILERKIEDRMCVAEVLISEIELDRLSHGICGEILNLRYLDLRNHLDDEESKMQREQEIET